MRQRLQARIDMLMENIALRHQLMVYERGRTARRSLSGNDRLLWCFLARFFSNWRDTLDIVQPATVTRWRRVRWWRHLLGGRRRRPGRPRIDPELQALILRMARENPRWGSMRILGELRHLGFELSNSTVRRYRGSAGDPAQQHWSTFYRNHGPYLAEALQEATIDSLRLMGTWIGSRLRLRVSAPRRQTKTAMPFVRSGLPVSGLVSRILAALGSTDRRLVNGPAEGRLTRAAPRRLSAGSTRSAPCVSDRGGRWTASLRSVHATQPTAARAAPVPILLRRSCPGLRCRRLPARRSGWSWWIPGGFATAGLLGSNLDRSDPGGWTADSRRRSRDRAVGAAHADGAWPARVGPAP